MIFRDGADIQAKIERAIEASHGEVSMATLDADIADGRVAVLEVGDSVLVTRVMTYDTGLKTLLVEMAAGKMIDIEAAEPMLMEIARHNGCARLYMVGRAGWQRALERKGWSFRHVSMMKEVEV